MIPLAEQEYLSRRFAAELAGRVRIDYFTQRPSKLFVPGREECATCEDGRKLLEELAALSEKITLTIHEMSESQEEAKKLRIDKIPAIVIRGAANRPLRFFGLPSGNEFPNFIEALISASLAKADVGPETARALKRVKDRVSITVYVTPTCPHCPAVVRAAYRLALASAHVDAAAVEIGEFPRLAQQLGIRAVPLTVINDRASIAGAIDEAGLIEAIRKAVEGELAPTTMRAGDISEAAAPGGPPSASPASRLVLPR